MRRSRLLFFLLLLSVTSTTGLANGGYVRQDPKSQEPQEAAKRVASNDEDTQAIEGLADLPFLDRPIIAIEFPGHRAFSTESLLSNFKFLKFGARYGAKAKARLEAELDLLRILVYVDNGYLRAHFKTPVLENTSTGVKISIPVEEGVQYRAGEVKILDAKLFSPDEILETLGLKKGDVIRGYSVINEGMARLKKK
ncbi:MAG: hypothetical protein HY231_06505 [Acidobacteria bacterium]|nr:hypothetical protein [Acidobacteriota bacterium]